MDFTVKKDSISACESRTVSSAEHTVDCDITLPEYMPDIVRVLRCTLTPAVASQQISGDRIMTECDCEVKMIYVCEQGLIHSFSASEHFGKQLAYGGEAGDGVVASVKTEYVNYRVSGSRKAEIHGAVTVSAECLRKTETEIVCEASGDGIAVRSKKMQICNLTSFAGKSFSVSETCEINCTDNIQSVISVSGYVRTDELKAIHGKLFLKGELCVKTAVLTEKSDVLNFENAVSVSGIIDVPDITDESVIDSSVTVKSINVRPRAGSGDRALLDIDACIYATVCAYDTAEITIIGDAYSTKYETETEYREITVNTLCEKLSDTFLCRESVNISASDIQRVLSFTCGNAVTGTSIEDDGITASGTLTAECIFENSNGEICFVTRQIPFEYKHTAVYENASANSVSATVCAYNYAIGTGGMIDVRAEIQINGIVFCSTDVTVTSDITLDKSKCKSVKTAPLTVYFADSNESLWNVARRYNTTVEAILRENRMQSEEITHSCKLLIPKI